ncbi:DUF5071 domain-containing protein [Hathewaya histolytica]|uniref:DUF5071 domain-containing protein n=1 Tax=Hathewaya histolytica TaxID=1498 RepID=A0A4U9QXZ0_HATHI|nr:DUF5071 domain-containing protein [Hathewaya histolytica]VTQ83552.1 Uncharacterised protein [Hathewaya histolytica]
MDSNILLNLSWNLSLDIQEEAICNIASIIDLNPKELLQPGSKEYWQNAAKVLFKLGYPKIREVIPGLLRWLQDINWPGSNIVMEVLGTIPKHVFIPYLEDAVIESLSEDDDIWIEGLSYFLEQFDLKESNFTSKEVYLALVKGSEFWK